MELICSTAIKKYSPRESYVAPYIRLPKGYDPSLIGQSVDIYKTNEGLLIKLKSDSDIRQGSKTPSINSDLGSSLEGVQGFESLPSHFLVIGSSDLPYRTFPGIVRFQIL
jgi:hypothetical protein